MIDLTTVKGRVDASLKEGLTRSQVSIKMGLHTPQTLNNWLYRESIPANKLFELADMLNVNPRWLLTGVGPRQGPQEQVVPLVLDWAYIPQWKGDVEQFYTDKAGNEEAALSCPTLHSALTFAIKIKNKTMEPSYQIGDLIFVDPNALPINGTDILCRQVEGDEPILRRLEIEGSKTYLVPINTRHAITEVPFDDIIIDGVVVFLGQIKS